MGFKQLIPIAVLTFFLTSCAYWPVPGSYREAMDCYDSTYTGIDTLINIHGFYREMEVSDYTGIFQKIDGEWVDLGLDTSYIDFLFFKDGLWIYNFGGYYLTAEEFLIQMADSGYTFSQNRSFAQGTYKIIGDTIILQTITDNGGRVFGGHEKKYRIINSETILLFHSKQLVVSHLDRNNPAYQPKYIDDSYPAMFHYVEKIPVSSSWLKNEEWFWCDTIP